ncbi:uncharacterized protein [Amphiura filiformis]|uniref:uncharacterized protein n=1 Tax=Amphiura filiformis TaxID=82378 RepID=UPI003B21E919
MHSGISVNEDDSDDEKTSSSMVVVIPSVQNTENAHVIRNYAGFHCYFQGLYLNKPHRAIKYNSPKPTTPPLRVLLWAPPRSLSTAFERCIASSGDDVQVYHEMYTAAYHLGPDRQVDIPVPFAAQMVLEKQFTYDWVQQELERTHSDGTKVIFCKELSYSVEGRFNHLPSGFKHTFLIRHPAKVFLSMNNLIKKFVAKHVLNLTIADLLPHGLVFRELYELFCYITNTLGQTPIIIDADDLIEHPERTLRAYCQAIGIPYTSSMMQWNPLEKERDRWNFSKRLMFINRVIGQYDRAFSTSTLQKGTEKPLDLNDVTPEVLHATESSVQYYEKLFELRLRPLEYDLSDGDHIDDPSTSDVDFSDHDNEGKLHPPEQATSTIGKNGTSDSSDDTSSGFNSDDAIETSEYSYI